MSFRAWGPKQNLAYARSIGVATVTAVQPVGFAKGGDQCKIYNSGAVDVLFVAYSHSAGDPTLTFPVDGSPPVGQGIGATGRNDFVATIVPKGVEKQITIPATADSFAAIGQAAGPTIIYVQRGDGSV